MNKTTQLSISGALVCLALIMTTPAEANEASLEVKLALTDQTRDQKPIQLGLTLSGAEGCASVDDRNQSSELHVQVCRDGGDDKRPVLSFHVERVLNLEKGSERRQFRVKLRMVTGRPQRIGSFGEGPTTMELVATASIIGSASLGGGKESP